MGTTQSAQPRTVTVDNQNPVNVIEISDEIVEKLKGIHAARVAAQREQKKQDEPIVDPPSSTPSSYPTRSKEIPTAIYYGEPSITAQEVRRQKEIELRNNDLYWQKRLKQLEKSLQKTNAVMEDEYNTTIDRVRKQFYTASPHQQPLSCTDVKKKVIECYKTNSKEPLTCTPVVTDFLQCVDQNRTQILDKKLEANQSDEKVDEKVGKKVDK